MQMKRYQRKRYRFCHFIISQFILFIFRDHPVFLIFMQLSIISIFKSYPTVGDSALYLSFLPVWTHLHRCKQSQLSFFLFYLLDVICKQTLSLSPNHQSWGTSSWSPVFSWLLLFYSQSSGISGSMRAAPTPTSTMPLHWCLMWPR